jgi:hypothetical protein
MPGKLDIAGQKFGRLTAIRPHSKNKNGTVVWEFRCDCGNLMYKPVTKRNADANVGCHACYLKHLSARTRVHGCSRITKEYRAWVHIKSRCYNPKVPSYAYYGAKGVAMHPEWKESFEAFLSYIGHAPSKEHSVDRIDNSKGYEPGNVRWATRSEQANNKTTNAMYTINGVTKTLAMWCAEYGMDWDLVWSRINAHGFDVERALTEPKRNHNKFCGEKGERIGYRDYMFKGKVQNLKQWADEYKVSHKALQQKIKRGWHMESALMGGSNV